VSIGGYPELLRRSLLRKCLLLALGAFCLWPTVTSGLVLPLSQCYEEQDQWCWAATSQSVLAFYGTNLTQTQIAQYGTAGANDWNWLYGSSLNPTRNGVDLILSHFRNITSTSLADVLTQSAVQSEIDTNGRPVVIRWAWDSGGGHILVLQGLVTNTAYVMDPWNGPTINSYNWVLQGSGHTWTDTLKLVTNPGTISVSPANRDFGSVPVGTTVDRTFTVQNLGTGTLYGTASVASPFSVVSGSPYSLLASQTTNVTVRYSPTAAGSNNQIVAFTGGGRATRQVSAMPYTYTTNSGTITIAAYAGVGGAVAIPGMINGLPVTSIGSNAFFSCASLTGVTIPTNVTSIGSYAFGSCTGLTSVRIPASVTNIGDGPFYACTSLTTITVDALNPAYCSVAGLLFNKSQTTLIQYPAGRAGSYTVPGSVIRIGSYAFAGCAGLSSITISNNVTSLGDDAFYSCASLTTVYFKGNAPSPGVNVFGMDNNATVYYLPGTAGWASTFGGRPAVLWNVLIQASGANFGVRTNRLGFNITGAANLPIVVEASTNLASARWTALQTGAITSGSIYFSDPGWTNYPRRFYRIRAP